MSDSPRSFTSADIIAWQSSRFQLKIYMISSS